MPTKLPYSVSSIGTKSGRVSLLAAFCNIVEAENFAEMKKRIAAENEVYGLDFVVVEDETGSVKRVWYGTDSASAAVEESYAAARVCARDAR